MNFGDFDWLEELQQYRSIGTVEECREAREKQRAKKPNGRYKTRHMWDGAYCPICKCGITARWNFCQSCGQAINWRKQIESIESEDESKMDKSSVLFERQEKEKVLSAEIVIHGTKEKPYYEIEYYDLDGECHIGYSSYDINFVYEWLEAYFEVVPQFDNSKKKRGESEILKEAWEEIEIITNSNINELCSQNRYSDARKLEDNRDIVKTALKLAGYKLGDEK